jgi:hypothetical protein
MAQAINDPLHWAGRRQQWVARVEALVNEIDQWARSQGWTVIRGRKPIQESVIGTYDVPILEARLAGGQIFVNPIGLNVIGAEGRVDIEAIPTLNRVKLIVRDDQWQVFTDSNVPLRQPWTADNFVQLVRDLLA